jgi:integrase
LEVIPTKAAETQHGNLKELKYLLEFFDNPPAELDQIQPIHIRQYLDWRKNSQVRANREKALFSHIWNKAREWGYTALANPCLGIKGYKESGRDVYVEDNEYQAVWNCADQPLRDAMDLAYLTGQRPADTLRFQETDIREGVLFVLQNKTKERLRVAITGKLADVIENILERKREHKIRSLSLVCNEEGKALSKYALRSRFDKARAKAGVQFQFRDLRAKAGTDKADSTDMREAQKQLGHKTISMTEHYVRKRRGETVDPTK